MSQLYFRLIEGERGEKLLFGPGIKEMKQRKYGLVTREQEYSGAVQDAQKISLILVINMMKLTE